MSASCTVTVAQLISSISMQGNLEIYTGDSQRLSVTITPSNATNKGLRWSSSNNNVASVNDGVVTGIAPGTATVTCVTTDGSKKSASCTVVVKQGVTGITLNKTYVINFYENYYELLVNNICDIKTDVVRWLNSFRRPLAFLYDEWLSCDDCFSERWDDMVDWIENLYRYQKEGDDRNE